MGRFNEKSKFEQLKAEKYHEAIVARRKKFLIRFFIVAAIVVGAYLASAFFFARHFFPNTVVNGVDCSWNTVSKGCEFLEHVTDGYTLTLIEKEGNTEEIYGDDINMHIDPQEMMEELLEQQNGFAWIAHIFYPTRYDFENTGLFDETSLERVVADLACVDEDVITYPVEPKLSGYVEGVGYEIVDPVYGNVVDESILLDSLESAIGRMETSFDLEETGCYVIPDFDAEIEKLTQIQKKLNKVVNTTITYEFGNDQVVLDGSQIHDWLVITIEDPDDETESSQNGEESTLTVSDMGPDLSESDIENMSVGVDRDKLAEFVADIADTYNTKYKAHTLINHAGETITVSGGNYGWNIDQATTVEELSGYLSNGEDYTGEVAFFQRAAQFGQPDYGDTYLEVSIAEQHFWYYRDGVLTLDSALVSGNTSTGHGTPLGTYQIAYKARNQTLTGENYSTPVSYWMPFYAGCGFHDASWRSSFGGTIYKYSGSHGCLNLPASVAAELYSYIEGGECVLIY